MTIDEFQRKYHDFVTENENEAVEECKKVNSVLEVTRHGPVIVKHFPCIGYCLMLKSASDFI